MKISSPDILHKSDIGAVILNIANDEEAFTGYKEIRENVAEHAPKARIEGILVQEMMPHGVEMIIGISSDAQFGPMLMIGMGGIFVEVFKDFALSPVPVSKPEAIDMLRRLKGYKLLSGYRSGAPCDVDALADMMVLISDYAFRNKDTLKELDLNPVFVYPEGKGICAADAVIMKYIP